MATLMLGNVLARTEEKYKIRLLAGGQGLYRSLHWLYFSEDIENADFLRGGELMLLTGHKFKGRTDLENFICMLIDRNACGVIIPLGKYLEEEDITPELLELCNQAHFPLMVMPWKYHFTNLIHDFSKQIFSGTHEQDLLAYTFQALLKNAKLFSQEDVKRLRAIQFDPNGEYCVTAISCRKGAMKITSTAVMQHMKTLIENHLNQWPEKIFVFQYQNQVILIFYNASCRQIGVHMSNILHFCEQSLPGYAFFSGVGSPLFGVENLRESYERACAAMQYGIFKQTSLSSFDAMELFQLLYVCQDSAIYDRFVQILKPLADYDRQCSSQLVETLRLYLQSNGSVNQVSDEMFCHRNTTNYRIKKIKSILGFDLEDSKILFRLQMAFYILEYQDIFGMGNVN